MTHWHRTHHSDSPLPLHWVTESPLSRSVRVTPSSRLRPGHRAPGSYPHLLGLIEPSDSVTKIIIKKEDVKRWKIYWVVLTVSCPSGNHRTHRHLDSLGSCQSQINETKNEQEYVWIKRTQGIVSVVVLPLIKNERLKTTYASITYHMKRMKEIVNQSVKVCLMLVSNEAAWWGGSAVSVYPTGIGISLTAPLDAALTTCHWTGALYTLYKCTIHKWWASG